MKRGYHMSHDSTDRREFPQRVHAEAHAILALRDAHTRLLHMRSLDEALDDLQLDIANRSQRLHLTPDAVCDQLEAARMEQVRVAAGLATCGGPEA